MHIVLGHREKKEKGDSLWLDGGCGGGVPQPAAADGKEEEGRGERGKKRNVARKPNRNLYTVWLKTKSFPNGESLRESPVTRSG